jgi:hypothetical protein
MYKQATKIINKKVSKYKKERYENRNGVGSHVLKHNEEVVDIDSDKVKIKKIIDGFYNSINFIDYIKYNDDMVTIVTNYDSYSLIPILIKSYLENKYKHLKNVVIVQELDFDNDAYDDIYEFNKKIGIVSKTINKERVDKFKEEYDVYSIDMYNSERKHISIVINDKIIKRIYLNDNSISLE